MKLVDIIQEDFINYKKVSMTLEFPYCSFKCDKEYGSNICQNSKLANMKIVNYDIDEIIQSYLNNPITESIVCQGLEPFDSFKDLIDFINKFRQFSKDDIVIYTGYTKAELLNSYYVQRLISYSNILIKYGRYIPNEDKHYDRILGVYLASNNQYAEKIS